MSNASFKAMLHAGPLKPAKDAGPWWWVILTSVLMFFASQIMAAIFVAIGIGLIHHGGNINSDLDNSAPAQFFFILLAEGLAVLLVLAFIRGRRLKLSSIGLGRLPNWRDLLKAAIGIVVFYTLLIVAINIISAIFPHFNTQQKQDVGFNSLNTTVDSIFAFVALVVLPPLGEETLVRGYLYSGLRARWKFLPAALVTSVIFGFAHLQLGNGSAALWIAGIDTFTLSLVLVYLRETTGALYAGMLVHASNNIIAFVAHFHSGILLLR